MSFMFFLSVLTSVVFKYCGLGPTEYSEVRFELTNSTNFGYLAGVTFSISRGWRYSMGLWLLSDPCHTDEPVIFWACEHRHLHLSVTLCQHFFLLCCSDCVAFGSYLSVLHIVGIIVFSSLLAAATARCVSWSDAGNTASYVYMCS